ncbi:tetratricopeptide repeat protein [Terasakiella sp.]|uniref:tetratricopeptide repeat protein n=1 Tax=Terasakiella sp. TaxID=2034861 RepID=UPI003AA99E41
MAEDDASVSNLFKEIDEELRQDKATMLWKQYGNTLIGAIVAVVICVAGYEGWKAYDLSKREEISAKYANALDLAQQQNFTEAEKAFKALSSQSDSGYATLANMQEAALLADQGKHKEAAEQYFLIAQNGELDSVFRDMALVLGAMNGLDNMDAAEISRRLQPLIGGTNPWRHSATELQAFAEAKAGNKAKALELVKNLAEDASAPAGMRQRAAEFAKAYAD